VKICISEHSHTDRF